MNKGIKEFKYFVVLTAWCISREQNNRVFNSVMRHAAQLASWIMEEGLCWRVAGFRASTGRTRVAGVSQG
jgi:hypothetical protein